MYVCMYVCILVHLLSLASSTALYMASMHDVHGCSIRTGCKHARYTRMQYKDRMQANTKCMKKVCTTSRMWQKPYTEYIIVGWRLHNDAKADI
jgi:hypothetical protein